MKSANFLIGAALEDSTKTVYKNAWRILKGFPLSHGLPLTLPLMECNLIVFVAYLFENNYAASTIQTMVSAISYVHNLGGFLDPSKSFIVKKLLQGSKKINKSADVRLPITMNILKQLLKASDYIFKSNFDRLCFKSMCILAFHALLRIGEMTNSKHNLNLENVQVNAFSVMINFPHYKHNGNGASLHLQINSDPLICPVRILNQYINLRGSSPGPFFINNDNTPVSRVQFVRKLNTMLDVCNLSREKFKSLSFRIGGATHLAQIGRSELQIKQAGRWESNAFRRYTRINCM